MLNKMIHENFQSWPLTTFNFHKGVNAITGVSDKGKSAIVRAYRAFAENKPGGTAYVSDWIKTKGGAIKKGQVCAITIEKENGTATRFRNEANGYSVNGKVLEAIGTGVPEEATNFLNMDEVNLQKQLDPPFLLGSTPGEVSRFFNKMIKLESIDKCLSLAEKRKRETNTALKINAATVEELEAEIEKLSNLEELEAKLEAYDKLEEKTEELKQKYNRLQRIVGEIRISEKRIKETESAVKAGEGLSALLELQSSAMELSIKVDRLNKLSASIVACEKTLEKTKSLAEVADKLEELGRLKYEKLELEQKVDRIKATLHTISKLDRIISDKKAISEINILEKLKEFDYLYKQVQEESQKLESLKQIKTKLRKYKVIIEDAALEELKLKNEFPSQCPLCGSSFGECKD